MNLRVQFPDGGVVAEVFAAPDCPFARDLAGGAFVWGSFTRGPAFPRLGALLDEFLQVFDTGSVAEASELHERIDRLGLLALDASGRAYHVSNVYFQEGGLLFNATPTAIG